MNFLDSPHWPAIVRARHDRNCNRAAEISVKPVPVTGELHWKAQLSQAAYTYLSSRLDRDTIDNRQRRHLTGSILGRGTGSQTAQKAIDFIIGSLVQELVTCQSLEHARFKE